MKITEKKPLTLQELLSWLKKRRGESKWWATSDQREIASYAEQYVKLDEASSEKLLKKLTKGVKLPREVAVQIVNTLPLVIDEVSPFIQQLKREQDLSPNEQNEKTKKILQITREIWEEERS